MAVAPSRAERMEGKIHMKRQGDDKLDRLLSSIAAAGAFAFFLTVISYGWFQAFQVMAQ